MAKISEIYNFIDSIAPFDSAMSWDNSGLLVERDGDEIDKITVCLDITPEIVKEAAKNKTQLIISHHPIIFHPLKRISADNVVRLLNKYNIAAICAHTNLDIAEKGVNKALADKLELHNIKAFENDGETIGIYGDLDKPVTLEEACRYIKEKLNAPYAGLVRAYKGEDMISRIAMCSGAGADFIGESKKYKAQAFLTGEAKHNELIETKEGDTHLILAGHFATEKVITEPLACMLKDKFNDCEVVCADDREPLEVF